MYVSIFLILFVKKIAKSVIHKFEKSSKLKIKLSLQLTPNQFTYTHQIQ